MDGNELNQQISAPNSHLEPLIKIEKLGKSYQTKTQLVSVLDNLSLEIYQGEFIALCGPSGSGKSTLLQLIGGLDKPSQGLLKIDGIDLKTLSDRKLSEFRGKTIGFIFQSFYLQPFLRLADNIGVPGMFKHMSRRLRNERVMELSKLVGLSDRLQHFPKELSGGQIQRAAVVRALLNQPKIILADEPTGNLDSKNSMAVIDLLKQICDKLETTVIIATHDKDIANRADRIISIKDGRIE